MLVIGRRFLEIELSFQPHRFGSQHVMQQICAVKILGLRGGLIPQGRFSSDQAELKVRNKYVRKNPRTNGYRPGGYLLWKVVVSEIIQDGLIK